MMIFIPHCEFLYFYTICKVSHNKDKWRASLSLHRIHPLYAPFTYAHKLSHTYSKMKNFLRVVGIGYDMTHVCKNNFVLFREDYANLSECPKCKSSRWKDSDAVKRIPHNVLRHFPITPRLQRLFHDAETREDVLWHSRTGSTGIIM